MVAEAAAQLRNCIVDAKYILSIGAQSRFHLPSTSERTKLGTHAEYHGIDLKILWENHGWF